MILNGKAFVAVWKDRTVPVVVRQRLLGLRTHTGNRTLYLFDSDGERPGWVSGDVIDATDWAPESDAVYIATVTSVEPSDTGSRFKVTLEQLDGYAPDIGSFFRQMPSWPHGLGNDPDNFRACTSASLHRAIFVGNGAADKTSFNTKGTSMSNLSKSVTSRVSTAVAVNGEAMKNAAFLEAGIIVNKQLGKVAATQLPMMLRGYAASPVGTLVIANLFAAVAREMRPNDRNLNRLAEASLEAAHLEVIRTLNIDELIDELLSADGVKRALGKLQQPEDGAA